MKLLLLSLLLASVSFAENQESQKCTAPGINCVGTSEAERAAEIEAGIDVMLTNRLNDAETKAKSEKEFQLKMASWKGSVISEVIEQFGAPDKVQKMDGYTFYWYVILAERVDRSIHNNTTITYQVFTTKNGKVIKCNMKTVMQ